MEDMDDTSAYGLTAGTPDVRSVGSITFGPAGILFVADNVSAKVYAVDVADPDGPRGDEPFDLADVDAHVGSYLGCAADDVLVQDMAVHPVSKNVYLSVQRGRGEASLPVLVRINPVDSSITDVPLTGILFSELAIAGAPAADNPKEDFYLPLEPEGQEVTLPNGRIIHVVRQPVRTSTITDLAYVDGHLLVAGLSNEEFSSRLRRIPFPFTHDGVDTALEIYHVSHGKWETEAPIRTFVPYGQGILASYTCTPVVHIPLGDLVTGGKIVGRTVAELGFGNQPLDMVTFVADGQEHLLVANSFYGLVRLDFDDINAQTPLTEPHSPVGPPRHTEQVTGVIRLANFGSAHVLALQYDGVRRNLLSLKVDSL